MGCAIVCSSSSEDAWLVQRRVFSWMTNVLSTRYDDSSRLVSIMNVAEATGGLSLDFLVAEDSEQARLLTLVLLGIAHDVFEESLQIPKDVSEKTIVLKNHFGELERMLTRFAIANGWDSLAESE